MSKRPSQAIARRDALIRKDFLRLQREDRKSRAIINTLADIYFLSPKTIQNIIYRRYEPAG